MTPMGLAYADYSICLCMLWPAVISQRLRLSKLLAKTSAVAALQIAHD